MSVDETPSTSKRSRSLDREPGQQSRRAVCYETARDGGERPRLAKDIDPMHDDAITVSEPDGQPYDDEPPDLPLPGSGDVREDCGDDIPLRACGDCGSPTWVGNTCRRSRCPRCWQSWVFQRAKEVVTAVETVRSTMYDRTAGNVYNHHVVISPPDGIAFNSDDPTGQLMEAGKILLGHVNAETGYLVYHPYRIKEEYRGDVRGHSSGDGEMQWKDVLDLPAEERDEYLTHSPHLHAFVVSSKVQTDTVAPEIHDKTGMVIHRIADDDGRSLPDTEALAAAVSYSLSHAGIRHNDTDDSYQVAARFFGETATISRDEYWRERADAAMREVAGNVLGVSFRRDGCNETVPADSTDATADTDTDSASATPPAVRSLDGSSGGGDGGSGGGEWPDTSGLLGGNSGGFDTDSGGPEARGASASGTAAPVDHDHDDTDTETCGGELRPIRAVYQKMLENDEWRAEIGETADALELAYEEWVELGEPQPEDLAPDDSDPPPD